MRKGDCLHAPRKRPPAKEEEREAGVKLRSRSQLTTDRKDSGDRQPHGLLHARYCSKHGQRALIYSSWIPSEVETSLSCPELLPWLPPLQRSRERPVKASPCPPTCPPHIARCPMRNSEEQAYLGNLHLVEAEAKTHVGPKSTSASQRLCASRLGLPFLCASVSSTGR